MIEENIKPTGKVIKGFLSFLILSAIANTLFLISIPSDAKNNLLFGFSAIRLVMLLLFILVTYGLGWLFFRVSKNPESILKVLNSCMQKKGWLSAIFFAFILSSLFAWIAFYAPPYLLLQYKDELVRLSPMILFLLTLSSTMVVLCRLVTNDWHLFRREKEIRSSRKFLLIFTLLLVVFLAIAIVYPRLTDRLKVGRYGVSILVTQIVATWVVAAIAMYVSLAYEIRIPHFLLKNIDWVLFLLIWLCAVVVWSNQSIEFVPDTYFTAIEQHIRPMTPNYEIYPRKDSQTYFNISESIVTGQGIFRSIDKALFVTFLGISNWINNGDYLKMLDWQILFLAFFPGILYLLGKALSNRWVGLAVAALAILQEMNAINLMDEFPVVSSKTLLTEPFMQFWTGLVALLFVLALQRSGKINQRNLFFICGGTLGFSMLFRLNMLFIIPFLLLAIMVHFFSQKKTLIVHAFALLLGLLVALAPWMIHNAIEYGDPLAFAKAKIEGVVIEQRYEKLKEEPEIILEDSQVEIPESTTQLDLEMNEVEDSAGLNLVSLSRTILRHFLNNIATSFSILPTSIVPQDLFHGARNQQFWGQSSEKYFEPIHIIVLIANLAIIALGIFTLTRKHKIAGLIPLVVYLGYYLSNGVALSSGNRYSQPVAWVIYFYYACGLISLSIGLIHFLGIREKVNLEKAADRQEKSSPRYPKVFMPACIGLILLIGSLPIIADVVPADRYGTIPDGDLKAELKDKADLGLSGQEFDAIITDEAVSVSIGQALYPLQLSSEEYETIYGLLEVEEQEDLFTFMFLDAGSNTAQRLLYYPGDAMLEIPNRADLILAGNDDEVLLLCVIESDYAGQVRQYASLDDVPIACFRSEHISVQ